MIIEGRVWVFGDNVDTDQILPGYAMVEPLEKLGQYAMAGSPVPDLALRIQQGDIIVAGKNFGCGSSREQAPAALQLAGVGLVIAESFARIFRRNAINIGLPVWACDLADHVKDGDFVQVDLKQGTLRVGASTITGMPLSVNVLSTLAAGGLINRVRQELGLADEGGNK